MDDESPGDIQEMTFNRRLNLCGETCPDTFVRTSLAMEELEPGSTLLVELDDRRSAKRVPRNMENHGYEHVTTEHRTNVWKMVFRKVEQEESDRWVVVG